MSTSIFRSMSRNTLDVLPSYAFYEAEGPDKYSLKLVTVPPHMFCDTEPPQHKPFEPEHWATIAGIEERCLGMTRLDDHHSAQLMHGLDKVFNDKSSFLPVSDSEPHRQAAFEDVVTILTISMFGRPFTSDFWVSVEDYDNFNHAPMLELLVTEEGATISTLNRKLLNAMGCVSKEHDPYSQHTPPLVALIAGLVFEFHGFRSITPAYERTSFYTMVKTYLKGIGLGLSNAEIEPTLKRIDFFCCTNDVRETEMVHDNLPSKSLWYSAREHLDVDFITVGTRR